MQCSATRALAALSWLKNAFGKEISKVFRSLWRFIVLIQH
jgi:hypothetical protein